jgi:glycosyltransferase involved in cell wall biosynthesis
MVGSLPPLGGISAYCQEIASALSYVLQVEFISFKHMYPRAFHPGKGSEDNTISDISSHRLRVNRNLTWYNPFSWLLQGLRAKGDLLHVQWWSWVLAPPFALIMFFFRWRHKPVVTTVHNVRPHESSRYADIARRIIFLLSDHFIVHSSRNKTDMQRYYNIPAQRISIIPHGVLSFPVDITVPVQQAKSLLGLNPDCQTILAFGAIRPYKGLDNLIEAVASLKRILPRLVLMIVGQPWEDWHHYQNKIEALGLSNSVCLQLGFIPSNRIASYFQAADLVVLPYRHFHAQTGVGMIALSMGKALLVSNVGGLPDLVSDRKSVVPPDDSSALAERLADIFTTPGLPSAMAEDSKKIAGEFDWERIAQKTHRLYLSLFRNHP